jgi:hypothetical protein
MTGRHMENVREEIEEVCEEPEEEAEGVFNIKGNLGRMFDGKKNDLKLKLKLKLNLIENHRVILSSNKCQVSNYRSERVADVIIYRSFRFKLFSLK